MLVRTIVEENPKNLAVLDVYSKLMQQRIIFIDTPIEEGVASGVIAQMFHLDSVSNKEISVYINTPGGLTVDGLAIYDASKLISSPIKTVCVGMAASMGLILMLMGQKRIGLEHSRFLYHQVSGGAGGKLSEMLADVAEAGIAQESVAKVIKEKTSLDLENHHADYWFGSDQALKYGIITEKK